MATFQTISKITLFILLLLLGVNLSKVQAQGSIFGMVTRSDFSTPTDTELSFYGYIAETDNELRLYTSDGADYENGFWYDDFQNFIGEAPGMQFDYIFFDLTSNESFHLSSLIEANSFQEEHVFLLPQVTPPATIINSITRVDGSSAKISWNYTEGLSYHLYRRSELSNGSFYRIDDPAGDLTSAGIIDSNYIDTDVITGSFWDYLIVAVDSEFRMGRPSEIMNGPQAGCCIGITGNIDGDPDELVDIGDLTVLIDYLFITYTPLGCPQEANIDADPDGLVDIGDLTFLIDFLFISYTPLTDCL